MSAPIEYVNDFLLQITADRFFKDLWEQLAWLRHDKVPRREYFHSRIGADYAYGQEPYTRTYKSQPTHPTIEQIWRWVEQDSRSEFDVVFLNGYEDGKDQLGWHADDSPEMDDSRPIAIVSLGAEREIWFRPKPSDLMTDNEITWRELFGKPAPEKEVLRLGHGSLCLMAPGMQDTHQHRIPKADRIVGPRISLTFRGYVKP